QDGPVRPRRFEKLTSLVQTAGKERLRIQSCISFTGAAVMPEQLATKRSIRSWLLIACTATSGITSALCSTLALAQAGQGKAAAADDLRPIYANAQDIAEGKRVAESS